MSDNKICWYCGEKILTPDEEFKYDASGEIQYWHNKCAYEQGMTQEKTKPFQNEQIDKHKKIYFIAGSIVIVLLLILFIAIKNGIENKNSVDQINYQKAIAYIQDSKWEEAIVLLLTHNVQK